MLLVMIGLYSWVTFCVTLTFIQGFFGVVMVDCVREFTAKKSCEYGESGLVEHFLFLFVMLFPLNFQLFLLHIDR